MSDNYKNSDLVAVQKQLITLVDTLSLQQEAQTVDAGLVQIPINFLHLFTAVTMESPS